jgi:hypothetical protein
MPRAQDPTASLARGISREEASQRAELIQCWEELDVFLQLTPTNRNHLSLTQEDPEVISARARFGMLFKEEIEVVQAARNAAAHSRAMNSEVLQGALELARELVRIVREGQALFANSSSETGTL